MVLAGPGSGKTYVITHRIMHLISECRIPPDRILVITFTKAAALEMQRRAISYYQPCSYVQFGTFHSVFYHILKLSNPEKTFSFAADEERIKFIKCVLESDKNIKGCHIDTPDLLQETEAFIKAVSIFKNRLSDEKKEKELLGLPDKFHKIYRIYEEWLTENHKLDFDDMIRLCYMQLKKDERLRAYWQQRFSHILIDEFQDINPLQYETIKLLNGSNNIFAVGDDDQAIYSFRGAKPELMKKFSEEFHAEKICMEINYRSAAEILGPAEHFIGHNTERFLKKVQAGNKGKGEFQIISAASVQEEYALIREMALQFQMEYPNKTQAILTRTNSSANAYRNILLQEASDTMLLEDMAAYLSFINCGQRRADFMKIMNKPVRYLPASILTEETIDFECLKKRLRDKPWIQKRVSDLQEKILFARRLDMVGQAKYIYRAMGYGSYYETCLKSRRQFLFKEKNGDIKKTGMSGYDSAIKKLQEDLYEKLRACNSIKEFQECVNKNQTDQKTDDDRFQVLTYHASKGLEFDRVYLPDLEYGRVPHGRMLLKEELEEERRMFYVALTRAKESLLLLYDKSRTGSPFLQELLD